MVVAEEASPPGDAVPEAPGLPELGPESDPAPPLSVPVKPGSLRVATEVGSLEVGVDWDDVGGAVYYLVRWRSVGNGGRLNDGVEVSSSSVTVTVDGFGEWVVRVEACNDAGCGSHVAVRFEVEPVSEPEPEPEPSPDPGPPLSVPAMPGGVEVATRVGSLVVGVDWDDVGGAVYYLVRWRSVGNGGRLNDGVEVSSSSVTVTVDGFGEWVVRVEACNDAGCGSHVAVRFEVEPAPEPDPLILPGLSLTVSPDQLAEDEGETSVVVAAAWIGGATRSEDTTVALSLSGTAEDPADYTASMTDLVIPAEASEGTATLTITPVDDEVAEGDETIVVTGTAGNVASAVRIVLADPLTTELQTTGDNSPPAFSGTGPLARSVTRTVRPTRRWATRWPPPTS